MRTNSHLAVDSPAARAAAVMVATLLLAVALAAAGVAGQRLLAATGPIIVAQDGSGHYASIAEAVAAAQHGDEILVRPGRYAESVTIDKDITLRGDGPAADVVIERTGDVLIMLQETSAEVANLTLRGDDSTQGMEVMGGAPTVRGVVFDGTGRPFDGGPCPDADACAGLALPGWNRRDGHRQFVPRRWRDHVRFGRQRHLR